MTDIVFHHYKESPYAEKIRTLLGYKQLTWRSVSVPRIAPKPDLTALTGGYRKVPVLQLGADVYCDTRLIAQEIERLAPSPTAASAPGRFNDIVEHWVDVNLFGKAVAFTFGSNVDFLPDELLADRSALRGAPLEREALKAAVPMAAQELTSQIAWVEQGLLNGQPFVNGEQPGSGDFTLYSTLWFARVGRFDFARFPATTAWMGRMQAFGHGERIDITAEDALNLAAQNEPAPLPGVDANLSPDASGLTLGQTIEVRPELLGHGTSVKGTLIALNPQRLSLRLQSERCGTVHVHFPRQGYRLLSSAD